MADQEFTVMNEAVEKRADVVANVLPGLPEESFSAPCNLAEALHAKEVLARSADEIRTIMDYFRQELKRLGESLHNAARFYSLGDESAAEAFRNATSVPGAVMPGPIADHSAPPLLAGSANPVGVSDLEPFPFRGLKETSVDLERTDEGKSFLDFAQRWQQYAAALRNARHAFIRFTDAEWTGETSDKVNASFDAARAWLAKTADLCEQMATQATDVVTVHKQARHDHVWGFSFRYGDPTHYWSTTLTELESDYDIASHNPPPDKTAEVILGIFKDLQKKSDDIIAGYRKTCTFPQLSPTPGPSFVRIDRQIDPKYKDGDDTGADSRGGDGDDRDVNPDGDDSIHKYDKPPPPPNDGGNGFPTLPTMPSMPMMPPAKTDPKLDDALAAAVPSPPRGSGGIKPASVGGGGVPAMPLQPWEDGAAAGPRPAAGAAPGSSGGGVPGAAAGMGGGMAGGPAGQGAGQGAGKGKRMQGQEESLYTEDREWTEGHIGRRRLKDAPEQ